MKLELILVKGELLCMCACVLACVCACFAAAAAAAANNKDKIFIEENLNFCNDNYFLNL